MLKVLQELADTSPTSADALSFHCEFIPFFPIHHL